MNMKSRIELIHLLGEELHDTALCYEKAKQEYNYVVAGYGVETLNCKEALKRRIKVLREELLELSKSL